MLITLSFNMNAQKWKDKLNALSNGGSDANAVVSTAIGNESQFDMIEPFIKSEKIWVISLKNGKLESIVQGNTSDHIKAIEKNSQGKVNKISVYDYASADHPEYPLSFTDNKYIQVICVKNVLVALNIDNGTYNITTIKSAADVDRHVQSDNSFKRIYSLTRNDGKDLTIESIREMLKNYFNEASKGLDIVKQKAADAETERRKKLSIKDKKVKSIEITTSRESMRYKETISYSVTANLADGTKIIAGPGNEGYLDDYKIEVTGMENNDSNELINIFKYTPNDKVSIKITSKYHPNITAIKTLKMEYEIVEFNGEGQFKFSNQAGQSPYNGINSRIELKQVKDSNSGETLLACKIFDLSGNKPHFAFKCKPNTQIELNAAGRNYVQETDGIGKNGYSGGNVKLIIDPSVAESYNINIINNGARGQKGKVRDGLPGQDGKTETIKQKLIW